MPSGVRWTFVDTIETALANNPKITRLKFGYKVRRIAARQPIDVLISLGPLVAAWNAALVPRVNPEMKHLVYGFNFTDLPTGISRAHKTMAYRNVDHFVVPSTLERKLYADYFSIPCQKIDIVRWSMGVPNHSENFHPISEPYFASVGGEARDYRTLIEAARMLPQITFVLVVRPHSLAGLDPPENVKVFVNLPPLDTWALIRHAEALIVPLRSASTPNGHVTIVGGMHLGKPLIVTRSEGILDYVEDNETALLVEEKNPASLRDAILKLNGNVELMARIGGNAKQFASQHCYEGLAGDYIARYIREHRMDSLLSSARHG